MVHFAKHLNFQSIDFLYFFAKRIKSLEKMIHQKKNRGHRPRSLNPGKAVAVAIYPIICIFYYLARALCMTWHVNLRAQ